MAQQHWTYTFASIVAVGNVVQVDGTITDLSGNTYHFPFSVPYTGGAKQQGLEIIQAQVAQIQAAQAQTVALQNLVGQTINVG